MAGYIKLKKGGLILNAEKDGEPVSEPVFVNGKQAGETPFSGTVPMLATLTTGTYTTTTSTHAGAATLSLCFFQFVVCRTERVAPLLAEVIYYILIEDRI